MSAPDSPGTAPRRSRRAAGTGDRAASRDRGLSPQERGLVLPRSWQHLGIDAAVLTLLLGMGVLGFHNVFAGEWRYLVAGFGGIVVGLGLALTCAWYRLGLLSTATAGLLAYVLLGSAFAAPTQAITGVVPSLESLRTVLTGFIFAWKDILTVAAPVGVNGGMLVVPFLGSLAAALLAGTLAWRVKTPYWAILPVTAMFILGIAFGTNAPTLPLLRGVLLVAGTVSWLAWRRHISRTDSTANVSANPQAADAAAHRTGVLRRLGLGAGVLVLATAVTALAGPALTAGGERKVLRDVVVPPVQLYDYPSPLMDFRQFVKDKSEDTLFTVQGLPPGERVRLAALDTYDGVVYNVNPQSGGNYAPVGDAQSLGNVDGDGGNPNSDTAQMTFNIADYNGVWLPAGGQLNGVAMDGPRADEVAGSLYYNEDSETALSTRYIRPGDNYSVNVSFPAKPEDGQLAQYDFAPLNLPEPEQVPNIIGTKAGELVGDETVPIEQVRQLERSLHENGFFSNGKEDEARSLSGHSASRMTTLLDAEQMIGDDEQYAVAMALMARHLGMPARVVMGFYPDPSIERTAGQPVEIKGKDVHAWVEIAFTSAGWVAFDPTPDKDNEPTPPQQQPKSTPKPQVLQPPPPPQEPAELPPDSAPEPQDAEQNEKGFWEQWGWLVTAIGVAMIPLAILLIPLLLIAWLKLRRRKRRAAEGLPSTRVSGGWSEVMSLATDMGANANAKATRREHASELADAFPAASGTTTALAQRADAAVFGGVEPTEVQVREYWDMVEKSLDEIGSSVGFWKRQRARFSPRSLVAEARFRLSQKLGRGVSGRSFGPAESTNRKVESPTEEQHKGVSHTWQQD
ncbi:transglutaminaseTgpA domain-containing protein [Arthrobacter crystallopoietes]|uniref:transglutaminase family protein n=1 Tax=Crystallibacter crystallopoietes TaxID=37928 RepID=UPI001F0F3493|nr:transglutaminase domain-containing protein [Arthrobacter crystallopoietes]